MTRDAMKIIAGAGLLVPMLCVTEAVPADSRVTLELASTTALPDVKGRIDHLAIDPQTGRIFIAALGNDSVEVLDGQGKHQRSLAGFGEPQGIAYTAASRRIVVANGTGNRVDLLDAATLKMVGQVKGLEDADNVRYDEASTAIIVGYGAGALALIDAAKGELVGRIDLPGHPESFQLERNGPRVFVNVPTAHKVVVVDRVKKAVVASWDLPDVRNNFPMALDESGRRLFVGARSPAVLLVLDIDTGNVVSRLPIAGDTDDLFFDAERRRLYVICGEGRIDVLRRDGPEGYAKESSIETAPKARTGLFIPAQRTLLVAAPADRNTPARILAFSVR